MILELVGLPGSGKSTFARELEQGGKWVRTRVSGRSELIGYNLFFLVRHPVATILQLFWLVKYRGDRTLWYTKFVNLFLVHNAKYMKASTLPYAILDQGHLQNIMSLFDKNIGAEKVLRYVNVLPHPDVALFFFADKEERKRRLLLRGDIPRRDIPENVRRSWEEASEEHFATFFLSRASFPFTTNSVVPGQEGVVMAELATLHIIRFVMHVRMPTEKAHGLQIAKTLEALARLGEHVELWIPRRKNPISEDVFGYYGLTARFPIRSVSSVEALSLTKFIGSIAYWLDAIFFLVCLLFLRTSREAVYYTRSAPVAWLLRQKNARVYFEAHLWPSTKEEVFCSLLAGVSGVVANSEGTRKEFHLWRFPNTTVIRNGVDSEKFIIARSREEARRELGIPVDKPIVMYVGSFAEWKGVATLCRAWKKAKEQFPEARLVLVGGDREMLKKLGEDVGSDERIVVLPHQSASSIPLYLHSADILVLPNEPITEESIQYTSPIKLFEYMASGRPIIASDLPAMREVLDETSATFFVAGNSDDLARQLAFLLSHPKRGEETAMVAREVVSEFTWEKRAERLRAFLFTT